MTETNSFDWIEAYKKLIAEPSIVISASNGQMYSYDKNYNRLKQMVNGKWVVYPNLLPQDVAFSVLTSHKVFHDLPKTKMTNKKCCGQ